jgi:tRNA (cmo5U34)-methyltransferase
MSTNSTPELMGNFFDFVSPDYDKVATSHIDRGDEYYLAISNPIKPTNRNVKILDIGCGTGLELVNVLRKVPNSHLYCIDLSQKMLEIMRERLRNSSCTISMYHESFLDYEYPLNEYDYIIASGALHHLLDEEKLHLFPKILKSLTNGGTFILGDYFVSSDEAEAQLDIYHGFLSNGIDVKNGKYHIDIPTTCENEMVLLNQSGSNNIKIIWESSNFSIIVARKMISL